MVVVAPEMVAQRTEKGREEREYYGRQTGEDV